METQNGAVWKALAGGAIGASALTALHESARHLIPNAPRIDRLGMEAVEKLLHAAGMKVPEEDKLFYITLAGDLLSNALYYSLVGGHRGKGAWLRGGLLGVAAGLGGILLPPMLGLRAKPVARTTETKAMTVAWYLVGGLAAAAAVHLLARETREE